MTKIRKYLSAMLLMIAFAIPIGASAQNANEAQASQFLSEIIGVQYNNTELAHASLARLYGGFIFSAFGGAEDETPTVLAKVLGYSNIVAMILGCVIMAYVIVGGALNTAASGELLGRSWSSVWLPMRTSVAFGMIMPATDSHQVFSVAQSLIMSLIILGSNAGTWLWQKGADEMALGTPTMPTATFYTDENKESISDIMNCALSRYKMYTDLEDSDELANGMGIVKNADGSLNSTKFMITTGGVNITSNIGRIDLYDCGTISAPTLDGTNAEDAGSTPTEVGGVHVGTNSPNWEKTMVKNFKTALDKNFGVYLSAQGAAIAQVHALNISAKEIEAVRAEIESNRGAGSQVIDSLKDAAIIYNGLENEYSVYYKNMAASVNNNAEAAAEWKSEITDGGWMRAGAFFFEATRFQGLAYNLLNSIGGGASVSSNNGLGTMCNIANGAAEYYHPGAMIYSKVSGCDERRIKLSEQKAVFTAVKEFSQSKKLTVDGNVESTEKSVTKIDAKSLNGDIDPDILNTFSNHLSQMTMNLIMGVGCDNASASGGSVGLCSGKSNDTSGLTSPFTVLTALGHGMIQISAVMWGIGLAAVTVAGAAGGSALAVVGVGGGISAFVYYLVASMMTAATAITSMGFMLAYVVPFLPVIA